VIGLFHLVSIHLSVYPFLSITEVSKCPIYGVFFYVYTPQSRITNKFEAKLESTQQTVCIHSSEEEIQTIQVTVGSQNLEVRQIEGKTGTY
jgi:pyruvate/2-oxoacid:ferredoxin oxidoreductase alpha subunit